MSNSGNYVPAPEINPWLSRARKGLIAGAVALIEIANVWADGPSWLHVAAPVVGTILLYFVPNAPKYADPRVRR